MTAVTPLRELIESGKNFGDFILRPLAGPIWTLSCRSETHNGIKVPYRMVSTLVPRQGRISESQQLPAPSKNCNSQSAKSGATRVYSHAPDSKKLLQSKARRPNNSTQ